MTQDISADHFVEAVYGYQQSAALIGALELGLFTAIGEGASTAAALAARIGAAERGARILADYLTAQGFLTKTDSHYALTPSSALFLDQRSPAYMGAATEFLAAPELRALVFADPAGAVRAGGSAGLGNVAPDNPVWVKFARAMVPFAMATARALAACVAATAPLPRSVLDVAAGHGMFGISVATAIPAARVTALDWGGVLAVAQAHAVQYGVADRYHTIAGDAFAVDWGGPYDLILLPNFLHHFDPGACATLLSKARAKLAEGGRVLAVEHVPDPDRVSPPRTARFALLMLFTTPHGDAYTAAELDAMGRQAGFHGIVTAPLPPGPQTMVEFLV